MPKNVPPPTRRNRPFRQMISSRRLRKLCKKAAGADGGAGDGRPRRGQAIHRGRSAIVRAQRRAHKDLSAQRRRNHLRRGFMVQSPITRSDSRRSFSISDTPCCIVIILANILRRPLARRNFWRRCSTHRKPQIKALLLSGGGNDLINWHKKETQSSVQFFERRPPAVRRAVHRCGKSELRAPGDRRLADRHLGQVDTSRCEGTASALALLRVYIAKGLRAISVQRHMGQSTIRCDRRS